METGKLISIGIVYAFLFLVYYYFFDNKSVVEANKVFYLLYKTLEFMTKACGILFFIALATQMANNLQDVPKWIQNLSAMSFGVYIFHQIIIDVMYYKTSLPHLLGEIWLPWFSLLVTTLLSFMLTFFLKKTRTGKFLIG